MNYYLSYHFMYAKTYKVEIINNKSLSDLLYVSKNSIKNLFDELLKENRGLKYVLSTKIILKKRINDNEHKYSTIYFNSPVSVTYFKKY